MLCGHCQQLQNAFLDGRRSLIDDAEWERFRRLICEACGGVLPLAGPDFLLDGLTRLGRFGLVADGNTVLIRSQ